MMRSGETPVLAVAVALAFLSVIPSGNLLLLLRLRLSLLLHLRAVVLAVAPEMGPGFSPDIEATQKPGL
jgi:hypothetical protein